MIVRTVSGFPRLFKHFGATVDPAVEAAYRVTGSRGVRKIKHSQFGKSNYILFHMTGWFRGYSIVFLGKKVSGKEIQWDGTT